MPAKSILLPLFLVCCISLCILYSAQRKRIQREFSSNKTYLQPPAIPQQDPFFGFDLVYRQLFPGKNALSRNNHLTKLFATYSHTFHSSPYGHREVWTMAYDNIRAIYSTDFDSFGVAPIRNFVFQPLLGDGLMTTDGSAWKHSRTLINPLFSARSLAESLKRFDVHVSRLLKLIPTDGSTTDLQPLFERLAMDSSSEFIFGQCFMTLDPKAQSKEAQAFLEAFNYAQRGVGKRMVMPFWNIFIRDPDFWKSCRTARAFVEEVVDRALKARAGEVEYLARNKGNP